MELEYHDISPANINAESKNLTNERSCCFFSAVTHFLFYIVELREFLIENKDKFQNNILLNLIALFELLKNPGTQEKVAPQTRLYDKDIYGLYTSIQEELFIKPLDVKLKGQLIEITKDEDNYKTTGILQEDRETELEVIKAEYAKDSKDKINPIKDDKTVNYDAFRQKYETDFETNKRDYQRDASELLQALFKILNLEISKCLLLPRNSNFDSTPVFNLIEDLCLLNIPFYDLYYNKRVYSECINDLSNPKKKYIHATDYNILLDIMKSRTDSVFFINRGLEDILEPVADASNNISQCARDILGNKYTFPNHVRNEILMPNKYIIIHIKRFDSIDGVSRHLDNKVTGINENIICDRFNNRYKLVGAICHGGNLSSGHYWYKKLNNSTNLFNNYDDTFPNKHHPQIIERNVPLDPTEVTVLLFRKMDEPYRIPYLDENKINKVILTNLKLYKLPETMDDFDKIKEYINLLVFYTNIYNSNYYLQFHELLCDVYDHLCCQIEYLLKTNDEELCNKISYHLKTLVYLANKYNQNQYNNQLLVDLHEYIKCEIEKLIELI
jgi:hypothetical protein